LRIQTEIIIEIEDEEKTGIAGIENKRSNKIGKKGK